jgi:hypothetical protein
VAGGNLEAHRFVREDATDGQVVAADAGDAPIGITDRIGSPPTVPAAYGAVSGDRVDIVHIGITDLELGGTVGFGQYLVAGADGVGEAYDPDAPTPVGARALADGVLGDIISVLVLQPFPSDVTGS